MLELPLLDQVGLFGIFFLFGMVLGVYYTGYKLLRYFIHFTQRAIFFQDILFFLTAAVATYMLLMNVDTGEVRGYTLIALCLGFAVYYFSLGALIFTVGKFMIDIFKTVNAWINRKIIQPIRRFVIKRLEKVFQYGKKMGVKGNQAVKKPFQRLKKCIKKENIA